MLTYRLNIVGVHLLLYIYMAQSFVLFTANIEDIRNLARKFVSDSVADKLAEFVSKATEEISGKMNEMPDISASNENHRNLLHNFEKLNVEKELSRPLQMVYKKPLKTLRNEDKQKQIVDYLSDENKELSDERDERLLQNDKWGKSNSEASEDRKENREKSNSIKREEKRENINTDKIDEKRGKAALELKDKVDSYESTTKQKKYRIRENNEIPNKGKNSREKLNYLSQYNNQIENKQPYHPDKQVQSDRESQNVDDRIANNHDKTRSSASYISHHKKVQSKKLGQKIKDQITSDEKLSSDPRQKIEEPKTFAINFNLPVQESENKHKKADESYLNAKYKKTKGREVKLSSHPDDFKPVDKLWDMETTRFRGINLDEYITTMRQKSEFDQYDNPFYPKVQYVATSGPVMLPKFPKNEPKKYELPWWEREPALPSGAQLRSWLAINNDK